VNCHLQRPLREAHFTPAPHWEPWDDVAERLSVAAVERPRQKGPIAASYWLGPRSSLFGVQEKEENQPSARTDPAYVLRSQQRAA